MNETLHIYTRISTESQTEGGSLDAQRESGIAKAKQLGMDYKVWNEGVASSSKDNLLNRPVLRETLQKIEDGEVKHLFVWNTDRLARDERVMTFIKYSYLIKHEVILHTPSGEVYVHDISRLARNIEDLHRLVREINEKGCAIHFVKENLHFSGDKNDPTQELLLSMLGAVYAFERSIMLERQREGIALAKQAGKYKGRPKTIDNHEIRRILAEGNSISKTANLLGVSMSSVQRAKREAW